MDLLSWSTVRVLNDMGVERPKEFPEKLANCEADDWDVAEDPHSAVVYKIYKSLTDVYGFYLAYISELIDDNALDLMGSDADNIEPCLIDLAASKIEVVDDFAPKFKEFKFKVRNNYEEWLTLVKDRAFRAGAPLRAELMDMVHGSHDSLGHEAEAESLGFNSSKLHPDIYMNELLEGMRVIHQVLPAIMKKLGIDREFNLDTSELRNDASSRPAGSADENVTSGSPWTRTRMLRRKSQRRPRRLFAKRSIVTKIANTAQIGGRSDGAR